MGPELSEFIRKSLSKGATRAQVAGALKQAHWTDQDIKAGLNAFAEVDFVIPVPRPKPYLSAREVFLYLVMFSALYCVCWHVGALLFDVVNMQFPDAAADRANYWRNNPQDSIRWSVSALVISLPVFFFTFRKLNAEMQKDPARRNSRPRKWLTYLTLLVATMMLMGDGGALVYNLLAGGLTTRFVLKVLTVALIAGGSFIYFLRDMREENIA